MSSLLVRATPAGMHFRGRNRDGQGDVSSSPDGGIDDSDNGAGCGVVDEEALTPAMVERTRHDENEELQELVVQVPTITSTTTQSFVLPQIGWELSEEAIALQREAIHREVSIWRTPFSLLYSRVYPITVIIAFLHYVTNIVLLHSLLHVNR